MEIEKKYRVNVEKLPSLSGVKCTRIEQHYICLSNEEEVRIRKKGDRYFITVKGDGMLERDEWESEIPEGVYTSLFSAAKGRTVSKDRYEIGFSDGSIAELDIYRGKLEGFLTVEVEFKSKEEADVFKEPDWFGKDITSDARCKNKNLAVLGWPEGE